MCYEPSLQNQTLNSDRYCFQFDQLKTLIDEKSPEMSKRKRSIVFHQDFTFLCRPCRDWYSLTGMYYYTRGTQLILHFVIISYFDHCKMLLTRKRFWKSVKTISTSSSTINMPSSAMMNHEDASMIAKSCWAKCYICS